MKKTIRHLCLFVTLTIFSATRAQTPELELWTIPPNQVNFSSGGPVPSLLPSSLVSNSYTNTTVSLNQRSVAFNSMHDLSGNLLFFVTQDVNDNGYLKVFDKTGKIIAALTYDDPYWGTGHSFANWAKEISIIPVPKSCNKYYIIVAFQDDYSIPTDTFYKPLYGKIDLSVGTGAMIPVTATSNLQDLPGTPQYAFEDYGGWNYFRFGIATTPYRPANANQNYFLYIYSSGNIATNPDGSSNPDGFRKYLVDATGINFQNIEATIALNQPIEDKYYSEMELVQLGGGGGSGNYRIAKAFADNNIYYCDLDYANGSIITTPVTEKTLSIGAGNSIEGLEFSPDGSKLYYSYHNLTVGTNGLGIVTNLGTTPAITALTPTTSNNIGFIEMGYDGKMYFNPYKAAGAPSNSLIAKTTPNSTGGAWTNTVSLSPDDAGEFSPLLPDQIDGQDYPIILPTILGISDACGTAAQVYTLSGSYNPLISYSWTIAGGTPSTYFGTAQTLPITWTAAGGTITVSYGCMPPSVFVVKSCCRYVTTNRVVNPDFSAGTSGYFSGIPLSAAPCTGNTYTVASSFSLKCSGWPNLADHTGGSPGKYLIVDNNTVPTQSVVWQEQINVCQGKSYTFSFWANFPNIPVGPPVQLKMLVNGVAVGLFSLIPGGGWRQYTATVSGSLPTSPILVALIQTGAAANYYGIDDIYFGYCCSPITISGNLVLCPGGVTTLTASGASTYTWTWPDGSSHTINPMEIKPLTSGVYTVTGSDGCGCINSTTVQVTVKACKPLGINESATDGDPITVFPNPNTGIFTITLNGTKESDILVYNTIGELVYTQLHCKEKECKVNISSLPHGLYTIKVNSEGQIFSQKIIKE